MHSSDDSLKSVVNRILSLLIDSKHNYRAKLTLFVGAGVSREYGIPTTLGFAKRFFEDALSGLDESTRATLSSLTDEEKVRSFIDLFQKQLDSDLAYAFFKRIEQEALNDKDIKEIITYDRIIDLWRNGYIKVIITTNFDSLIEKKIDVLNQELEAPFEVTVLDYHDLSHDDRPTLIESAMLVKIAGQIERSNMIWTEKDFKKKLTRKMRKWLAGRIIDTPVILLGYTASEYPLAELLTKHQSYMASVAPLPLVEIATLFQLSNRRHRPLDHVQVTAGKFVETLYESLYQHTKDPNLALSFLALNDRIKKLNADRISPRNRPPQIRRTAVLETLRQFSRSSEPAKRCLVVLGESGYGKSTILEALSETAKDELYICIPGNELHLSLDEWMSRLDNNDIDHICRLTRLLSKNVVIAIDGLNECLDTTCAKTIIKDVIRILDLYNDGHVRIIITCRTEYWRRLKIDFNRVYVDLPVELERFNDYEMEQVLSNLTNETIRLPRMRYIREMLKVPQLYGFFAQLKDDGYSTSAETSLFRSLIEERHGTIEGANRALIWLCTAMRKDRRLSLPLLDIDIAPDIKDVLVELTGVGTLNINRFDIIRFAEDRLAEFVFGNLYLYEYCYLNGLNSRDIGKFFQGLVEEYMRISHDSPDYKVHFLNSLVFFVARCSDDEIVKLYPLGSTFGRTIIRTAVLLRRTIGIHDEFINDSVIMSVAVLTKANYEKLLEVLLSGEDKFFTAIPFNYGAKLFPENFLDFIEFLTTQIIDRKIKLEKERKYSTLLVNSILIYLLRNGPSQLMARRQLLDRFKKILRKTSKKFVAARLHESLEENSRFLFHYHPTAKLSDILYLEWYWRELLLKALKGCAFDLSIPETLGLLNLGSAVRLIMRFLFCRDIRDERLTTFVTQMFQTDDAVAHDFCLGLLGFAGKTDSKYIQFSADAVTRMCRDAPQNFYKKTLDDFEEDDSQYDPLVPHVTSLMFRGLSPDILNLMPEKSRDAAFRVGRLAQKTILDFPDETLKLIYDYLEKEENHPEILTALRAAARFSPASFWKFARQHRPDDLFLTEGDEIGEITRIIAQVRDFDWYQTVSFITASEERRQRLTELLTALLEAESLESYFQSIIESMTE